MEDSAQLHVDPVSRSAPDVCMLRVQFVLTRISVGAHSASPRNARCVGLRDFSHKSYRRFASHLFGTSRFTRGSGPLTL